VQAIWSASATAQCWLPAVTAGCRANRRSSVHLGRAAHHAHAPTSTTLQPLCTTIRGALGLHKQTPPRACPPWAHLRPNLTARSQAQQPSQSHAAMQAARHSMAHPSLPLESVRRRRSELACVANPQCSSSRRQQRQRSGRRRRAAAAPRAGRVRWLSGAGSRKLRQLDQPLTSSTTAELQLRATCGPGPESGRRLDA